MPDASLCATIRANRVVERAIRLITDAVDGDIEVPVRCICVPTELDARTQLLDRRRGPQSVPIRMHPKMDRGGWKRGAASCPRLESPPLPVWRTASRTKRRHTGDLSCTYALGLQGATRPISLDRQKKANVSSYLNEWQSAYIDCAYEDALRGLRDWSRLSVPHPSEVDSHISCSVDDQRRRSRARNG
ncbi:hypothetical protein OH76DRAFT_1254507 [Lentinus brumalis]|uniref:Uncharacterized protein n=1 Tax=Lentinus brumalis TaxID=2498619 RepID=A0A371CRH7_9APHY|nr:hypothetical protein OH76DRAFT_1254507 [Polyporus brumalis]